jgi:hypothetical protein
MLIETDREIERLGRPRAHPVSLVRVPITPASSDWLDGEGPPLESWTNQSAGLRNIEEFEHFVTKGLKDGDAPGEPPALGPGRGRSSNCSLLDFAIESEFDGNDRGAQRSGERECGCLSGRDWKKVATKEARETSK